MHDERTRTAQSAARRTALLTVAVVALVVVAAAALYAWREIAWRRRAVAELDRAIARLEAADERVAAVDGLVGSAPASGIETRALEAVSSARRTASDVYEVAGTAERLALRMSGAEQERARLVAVAASARRDMLAEAPAVLTLLAQASRSLGPAVSAWERVLEADRLTKRAVRAFNEHRPSSVRTALRLHERSAQQLERARAELVAAEEAFPRAPLESFIAYVDARRELAAVARQACTAWLEGRIAASNGAIERYNEGDERAVSQARSLPPSPGHAVVTAYEKLASEPLSRYRAARERAVRADERLRVR